MVTYNDVDYFYVYNLQGDVVALIDANGTQVVEYGYDAWGNPISKTGSLAATIGTLNPFRYRGYVYDEETGLYYLKERYYNPEWRRFVNSDSVLGIVSKLKSHNCYEYCHSSPMVYGDSEGNIASWIHMPEPTEPEYKLEAHQEKQMSSEIAAAFHGAGYKVLEGYQYESSSVSCNIITVVHYKIESRRNVFGQVKLVKPVDECKIQVNVDKHWTYSDYYYAGVGMRDDFLNVADTAVGNNTLSVIIGIMNLLYSFVVDPIVDMIPTTTKEPSLVYRKFGKRKQYSEPF